MEKEIRYSRQREVIYEILKGTKSHPDAEWIYRESKKILPDISLGTVYRNLKFLTDSNRIITLETTDGCIHYDADITNHMHFVCIECQKIIDLFIDTNLRERVEYQGHKVHNIKSLIYGTCNACIKPEIIN